MKSLIGKLQISQKEFLISLLLLCLEYEWTSKAQQTFEKNLQNERDPRKKRKGYSEESEIKQRIQEK